jgi:hypothetical protein
LLLFIYAMFDWSIDWLIDWISVIIHNKNILVFTTPRRSCKYIYIQISYDDLLVVRFQKYIKYPWTQAVMVVIVCYLCNQCNQCLSPLSFWFWIPLRWGVLDTTLCDMFCQWLAAGPWFSPGTLISSTNKTDRYDILKYCWKWS